MAQVSTTTGAFQELSLQFTADREGYVLVYTANQTAEDLDVFIDDLLVEHIESPVIRTDDYYPFGLAFNSSQRTGVMTNKFLYNGKELQEDLGLDWYDYGARMYDAVLGRWNHTDPLATTYYSLSPYCYVANNPLKYVDPDGKKIRGVKYKDGAYSYTKSAIKRVTKKYIDARTSTSAGKIGIQKLINDKRSFKISVTNKLLVMPTRNGKFGLSAGGADPNSNSIVISTNTKKLDEVSESDLKNAAVISATGDVVDKSISKSDLVNPYDADTQNEYLQGVQDAYSDSGAQEYDSDPDNTPKSDKELIHAYGAHEEEHLTEENIEAGASAESEYKAAYNTELPAYKEEVRQRKIYRAENP